MRRAWSTTLCRHGVPDNRGRGVECAIKTARAYHSSAGNGEKLIYHLQQRLPRPDARHDLGDQSGKLRKVSTAAARFAYARSMISTPRSIWLTTHGWLLSSRSRARAVSARVAAFPSGLRDICDHATDAGVRRSAVRRRTTGPFMPMNLWRHPDIMASAKGIGGGFRWACLATEKAARGMVIGTQVRPMAQPARLCGGQAVLDVVLEEGFLDQVKRPGTAARRARHSFPIMTSCRQCPRVGLMLGSSSARTARVRAHLRDTMAADRCGRRECRSRAPPLNIDDSHIAESSRTVAGAASYTPPES